MMMFKWLMILWVRSNIRQLKHGIEDEEKRHQEFDARIKSWRIGLSHEEARLDRLRNRGTKLDWGLAGNDWRKAPSASGITAAPHVTTARQNHDDKNFSQLV